MTMLDRENKMNDNEMTMIKRVAKWVAVTYGIEAIKDMAENLPKYIDEYNEAFAEFVVKMQKSQELQDLGSAQVYAEIRGE